MFESKTVGTVVQVNGTTATGTLSSQLAGGSALWEGRVHPIGQVGTLVAIPQGTSKILARVTQMNLSADANSPGMLLGERSISIELIGEISLAGRFERGVAQYPRIGDAIQLVSSADLETVFQRDDTEHIAIGALSANPTVPVTLDLRKLLSRHSAIVGSTGSGKSSAVASILQAINAGPWESASVLVIDTHGEYAAALDKTTAVVDLATAPAGFLPYWILSADNIVDIYCPGCSQGTRDRVVRMITKLRQDFAAANPWAGNPLEVSRDSPVPFDLNDVWFEIDSANRRTLTAIGGPDAISSPGRASTLESSEFTPHSPSNTAPYKGPEFGQHSTAPDRMRSALRDASLQFLNDPRAGTLSEDPLPGALRSLVGLDNRICVLDTSGIHWRAAEIVVATILHVIFELARGGDARGIGRENPMLVVIDEAHRYFASDAPRTSLERLSREGRKHGVGTMLVTQRPSELPPTALSQVGTILAMRLNNPVDQAAVTTAMPDGNSAAAQLSGLRTGEAVISGEAVPIPVRTQIVKPAPWPASQDPSLDPWLASPKDLDLTKSIETWRKR